MNSGLKALAAAAFSGLAAFGQPTAPDAQETLTRAYPECRTEIDPSFPVSNSPRIKQIIMVLTGEIAFREDSLKGYARPVDPSSTLQQMKPLWMKATAEDLLAARDQVLAMGFNIDCTAQDDGTRDKTVRTVDEIIDDMAEVRGLKLPPAPKVADVSAPKIG